MFRRAVCVAVAALVCACDVGPFSSPPAYGFIVVTTGSAVLRGGSDDVPPSLDMRIHAQVAFRSGDVSAKLDGKPLSLQAQNGDQLVSLGTPLPLASAHHLDVAVAGRDDLVFDFNVVPPTAAMLAAHHDPSAGVVVDAVFAVAPSRSAVTAAAPGASVSWSDATHARISWTGATPSALYLPAGIPTAQGSHLAAPVHLDLGGIGAGELRRVTVPAAPPVSRVSLVAFATNTAASNTSAANHLHALTAISPTGWAAAADGTLVGSPDAATVDRARAAGTPLWPLVANDASDPASTSALLENPSATAQLVTTLTQAAVAEGFAGLHLDFEGVPAADRDRLTVLVRGLATALHTHGVKLAVDIVPHGAYGTNQYSAAYDVQAIGTAADLVDVMLYDEHGEGGSSGPVAGLDWDRAELAATLPGLTRSRTLLGIPLYARRWDSSGGTSDTYSSAVTYALGLPGARVDYDFPAQTPFIHSGDGTSVTYFDDADSLGRKLALVSADGLAGAAAWRLGYEDPAFWSLLG